MYSNINDVKNELKELCSEYVHALKKLKDNNIISKEVFDECSEKKVLFLQE